MDNKTRNIILVLVVIIGLAIALYIWYKRAKTGTWTGSNFQVVGIYGPSDVQDGQKLAVDYNIPCSYGVVEYNNAMGKRTYPTPDQYPDSRVLKGTFYKNGTLKTGYAIDRPQSGVPQCFEVIGGI